MAPAPRPTYGSSIGGTVQLLQGYNDLETKPAQDSPAAGFVFSY